MTDPKLLEPRCREETILLIAWIFGPPVQVLRGIGDGDWHLVAVWLPICAISVTWSAVTMTRAHREHLALHPLAPLPVPEPFRDDPASRARVEAGHADLAHLRSQLDAIRSAPSRTGRTAHAGGFGARGVPEREPARTETWGSGGTRRAG